MAPLAYRGVSFHIVENIGYRIGLILMAKIVPPVHPVVSDEPVKVQPALFPGGIPCSANPLRGGFDPAFGDPPQVGFLAGFFVEVVPLEAMD